jgi:hypothetical protein
LAGWSKPSLKGRISIENESRDRERGEFMLFQVVVPPKDSSEWTENLGGVGALPWWTPKYKDLFCGWETAGDHVELHILGQTA